jgi:DNA processing protein
LDKLRLVPVYVRSTGEPSAALDTLRRKGAIPWPNPQDVEAFEAVFDVAVLATPVSAQTELSLFSNEAQSAEAPRPPVSPASESVPASAKEPLPPAVLVPDEQPDVQTAESSPSVTQEPKVAKAAARLEATPADALFTTVREVIQRLLKAPMKDPEVATALDVSNAQAKAWLQRLVDEGVVEKQKKPAGYIIKQARLFE